MPTLRPSWTLTALLFVTGCAAPGAVVLSPQALPPPPADPCGVIFSADGAGGFQATSQALRQAVGEQGLPLLVEAIAWSHGYGRVLADQTDRAHLEAEGRRLAERVAYWRQRFPDRPVYLVGHSAGCGVVLAATDHLPPGGVERVVLLAPAASASQNLRPALACARQGVDVFHSRRDWGYLGVGIALAGTTDRRWAPAAGRVGFHPAATETGDDALFAKLRQHPWDPCVAWTGNRGGHYGTYQPTFLRAYVLPLLTPDRPPDGPRAAARITPPGR
jgi:pimeloyl-ACP methyl ester carboxylesterase